MKVRFLSVCHTVSLPSRIQSVQKTLAWNKYIAMFMVLTMHITEHRKRVKKICITSPGFEDFHSSKCHGTYEILVK